MPEQQNGAGSGVGASAAADAVPLQDAHRTPANFRIQVESSPNLGFASYVASSEELRTAGPTLGRHFVIALGTEQVGCPVAAWKR